MDASSFAVVARSSSWTVVGASRKKKKELEGNAGEKNNWREELTNLSKENFELLWSSRSINSVFFRDYKLIRQLGQGGFGRVFYAERRVLQTPVAVKFCTMSYLMETAHPKIRSTNPGVNTVPTEINAMIELVGVPGVAQIEEAYWSRSKGYIVVMKEIPNSMVLHDYIKSVGYMQEEEACVYFSQIARAVKNMHRMGRHHMDLKAQNVLVDPEKRIATVIDLGSAQRVSRLRFNQTVGTYLPPEFHWNLDLYGEQCDVWCLGLMLYHMTMGRIPKELMERDTDFRATRPISKKLTDLLSKCFYKNPRTRAKLDDVVNSAWIKKYGDENTERTNETKNKNEKTQQKYKT